MTNPAIELILQDAVSSGMFLGVSFIAIDKTGNTIYSGSHGRRTFDSDEPMTLATPGWLASMTKLMTAVAVLHTVQRGLVTLDEDVADILPELRDKELLTSYNPATKCAKFEPLAEKITLRRLLTHSAGFVYHFLSPELQAWAVDNNRTIANVTGDFKNDWDRPMSFQPGAGWGYGEGLDWAGKVVERVSGQSLGEYLQQYVWKPLEMKGATFHPETRESYPMLEMGRRENGPNSKLVPGDGRRYPIPAANEAGGAGVFASADDYAKLLAALLRDDAIPLEKDMLEELVKPQLNDAGKESLKAERDRWVFPEIPRDVPVNYALGGLLTAGDSPGGRPKGAIAWDGFSNSNWLLDRGTGVAFVLITQILPEDPASKELWSKLERAVYDSLNGR
ncbi:hypothetical protein N7462_004384 [Penicillium macrosclerotiorum]|uniref:uncharacterized protein n=1 Tax=Penicillium macrosclerotiorum TaxID=303699 RepID=UPI002547AAC3|nr:uncharacterized protein N7462_004384 [Penicillium macrosclerotiorum]KAJ5689992.1 hypothetical protein N7462_004384 [Penicillium macrosclerotiorum]